MCPRHRLLLIGLVLVVLSITAYPALIFAQDRGIAGNPIPEPVQEAGLAVALEDFVRIPPSRNKLPRTRINQLTYAGDGSDRLYVGDMTGKVYVVQDKRLFNEPFLDLRAVRGEVMEFNRFEKGLLSFAFHPDYSNKDQAGFRKFYTASSEAIGIEFGDPDTVVFRPPAGSARHHVVITEWMAAIETPDRIDPSTRREVLRIGFRHSDHQVGKIAFNLNSGPGDEDHGLMYIAVGDGGNTFQWTPEIDIDRQGQDTKTPFGAILRINPLQKGDKKYSIPPGNPFAVDPGHKVPEIWAFGFRNPQSFSWDTSGNQAMYIADIGQANIEEIKFGAMGGNYGWIEREGIFVVDRFDQNTLKPLPADDHGNGYIYPIAQYDHDEGQAVTGGFVYRGRQIPDLYGKYVFGDIVNGRIFYIDTDEIIQGEQARIHELRLFHDDEEKSLLDIIGGVERADLRFGADRSGELFVLTKQDGMIRKVRKY